MVVDRSSDLPGVDLDALARWLDEQRPGLRVGNLTGQVIAGGKSNLTYRITDGVSTWALRRPPLAHVLPTAHDITREYTVMTALAATAVPVPGTIALCTDPGVLGADFYLMSFVDGVVLDHPEALRRVTPELARSMSDQLVDTLVELHGVEPHAVGLADFGRPDGFLARQLRRWERQWQASMTEPRTAVPELLDKLTSTMPEQSRSGIVHGDYRLTNVMYRPDLSGIAAVVDWEMAALGDPLTDLGLLVVYQTLSTEGDPILQPTRVPGFPTADEVAARYATRSDRDLSDLDWYVALGYFKIAVISEGIHHRYLQGKTVGDGFAQFGSAVPRLLSAAERLLAAR
jgi:aminoglycoside phosphotransferase (APT) family kinase protein